MALSISLNGVDCVGKTTQVKLLPRVHSIKVGSVPRSEDELHDLTGRDGVRKCWWNSSDRLFAATLYNSLSRRYSDAMSSKGAKFAVFKVVMVASIAVNSEDNNLEKAREKLKIIAEKYKLELPRAKFSLLLKHGHFQEQSVKMTLERESEPVDAKAIPYRRLLSKELQCEETAGV